MNYTYARDSLRLLRAAHLIAARMQHPAVAGNVKTVDGFMRYSTHIAASFYLPGSAHRRACELAVAYGERELSRQILELEAADPQ